MQRPSRAASRTKAVLFGVIALSLTLSATAASAAGGDKDGGGSGVQRETGRVAPRADDKGVEPEKSRTAADAGVNALADTIDAYQRVDPELTLAQARAAAEGQDARKQLWDAVLAKNVDAFGGAWYDPRKNTLHVNVTNDGVGRQVLKEARAARVSVTTHLVEYSFDELDTAAGVLRSGKGELGQEADGHVGLDVRTNEVVVQVPADQLAQARKQAPRNVRVEAATKQDIEADACTDRNSCPDAVRAGSIMWKGSVGNDWCSVGATALSSTTNRRYVLTAGHCVGAGGESWGTANRTIGTRWAQRNSGDVDVATIWVNNWPFSGQSNGEIWAQWRANRAVDMDGVAPSQAWIWVGDTVCLAANYTDPDAGSNRCGVVGANADASVRGMTRVDGVDACGGDSGGGWYWLTSSGIRFGYGVHSRSDTGCNGSAGGDSSWFTTLPRVKTWIPSLGFQTQ